MAMKNLAGVMVLLLLSASPTATPADSAVRTGVAGGTIDEKTSLPVVPGRKVYFMDGSVGFVRPDGVVLFEEERQEPPPVKIRVRLRPKQKSESKKEGTTQPDWYRLSKPTGTAGERIWLGPAALFRFGDPGGKVLTIAPDGRRKIIQTYKDGSRLIDDQALPHLRRILPDGTTLVLERPRSTQKDPGSEDRGSLGRAQKPGGP
ncbi:MAG: hypothetical protein GWN87_32745 [Desulfuromonadales bacterium]|nr:hypothetical protein [Desulfuromonadales bacterium]NIS44253.1 hypothetical protein [Desulfuromonadales bacterium]